MQIYLVDDQKDHLAYVERLVIDSLKELKMPHYELFTTQKIQTFLHHLHLATRGGLYILDIELHPRDANLKELLPDGIEVAKLIRQRDPYAFIVFVTSYPKHLLLSIKSRVKASNFIDKSESADAIKTQLKTLLREVESFHRALNNEDSLMIESEGRSIKVPIADIYYIETLKGKDKRLRLVARHRDPLVFYGKLSDYEDYDRRLIRCHRSFIVNTLHILEFNKPQKTVTLTNGEVCYVSESNVDRIQKSFIHPY